MSAPGCDRARVLFHVLGGAVVLAAALIWGGITAFAADPLTPPSIVTAGIVEYRVTVPTCTPDGFIRDHDVAGSSCTSACTSAGGQWLFSNGTCRINILPCGGWNSGCGIIYAPCPTGYEHDNGPQCRLIPARSPQPDVDPGKTIGEPQACVGNPCDPATGNKYEVQVDYVGSGPFPLQFVRYYNSLDWDYFRQSPTVRGRLGPNWRTNYDRSALGFSGGGEDWAAVRRGDGRRAYFKLLQGVWQRDPDVMLGLQRLTVASAERWSVKNEKDETETYDLEGRLLSVTNRAGLTQTFSYDADGRLVRVQDPFGRALVLSYDGSGRLSMLRDPAGQVVSYAYDEQGRLSSVRYPDGSVRAYLYNESTKTHGINLPFALTGIVDESGVRYASFEYDNTGRALVSEHAGGAERISLVYQTASQTEVTDSHATQRIYSFETSLGVKRLTGITQPCLECPGGTSTTTWIYDENGNRSAEIDFRGTRTDHQYDLTRNLETSRTEAIGAAVARTTTTEWHPTFRLPLKVAEPKRVTTYQYDSVTGRVLSETIQATTDQDGSGAFSATPVGIPRTWSYSYQPSGTPGPIESITENGPRTDATPDDVTTRYFYPADFACMPSVTDGSTLGCRGQLRSIVNALGHETQLTRYTAHGQPEEIIDPNGLRITLAYDARQRLISRSRGVELTRYEYWPTGLLKQVTMPDQSFLTYAYDDAHRLTRIQDNLGNTIVYTLDAMGNRTKEELFDSTGLLAQKREHEYDNLNRLIKDIGATDPAVQITRYGYDAQGNLTGITDPLNQITSQTFDPLNRLASMIDPAHGQTQYGYDGLDQLTQVTDPRGLTTAYSTNGLGDVDAELSPDAGASASTYDAAGNLLSRTDARGVVTSYAYDALNRITQASFAPPAGGGLAAVVHIFGYDQGVNGSGRLTSVADPTGSTLYGYDQLGRLTSETRTVGGRSYVTTYTYDTTGRLSGLAYPTGRDLTYSFDALGRINAITTTLNGQLQTIVATVAYRPFREIQSFGYGNGQTYSRSYDLDGRVAAHSLGASSAALSYDVASRITGVTDSAVSFGYSYDALDRLTGFTAPQSSQSFQYDAVGNRVSQTVGASSYAYAYPASSNRLGETTGPTARTYSYDATGNTLSDGRSYLYDARGRLIQASGFLTAAYGVNALGERVTKTIAGKTTVYHYDAQGHLIAETDADGPAQREYIWLGELPVAVIGATPAAPSCPIQPTLDASTSFQPFAELERLEVRSGRPGPRGWEWGLGVNTHRPRQSVNEDLDWVKSKTYGWTLSYSGQGAGTMTVFDAGAPLFTKTWNVASKPLRTGNALRFYVKADASIPAGNLIAVTVTSINGKTVNATLQTDGTGNFSEAQSVFAGLSLTQGFSIQGTIQLTFTRRYPPRGSRLNFLVNAGTVTCAQASSPATDIAYIQPDHLGTPRTVTDGQQRVIWKWEQLDPFGANAPSEDPDGDGKSYTLNLRFPGQYYDAETGLQYNYFRDYDPDTGRYIEADPIGLAGGLNLYGYVGSMPTRFADPYGLEVGEPGFGESFIPVWGSGRQAINDFQTGHYIWGSVNSVVALSDVALVGYGVKALCKGAWRLGSHAWGATRKWYGKSRKLAPNTPVHHWAIPQGSWGKQVPDIIKNQPWNLNPMPDWATHANIHGYGPDPYNALGRWWYGTPDWAKIGEGSLAGKAANAFRNDECNCAP